MSILINGMNMPDRCGHCRFATAFDCDVDGQFIQTHDAKRRDCPLIEVPEHGRLIDADALDDICRIINEREYETGAYITRGDYKIIDRVLFEFPTIIPAEREET